MAPEISSASRLYLSAPTSPSHLLNPDNNGAVSFNSVPASATRTNMLKDAYSDDLHSYPTTTSSVTREDANFNVDDFEFDTGRRFNFEEYDFCEDDEAEHEKELHQQQECYVKQCKESLPAMAFAEELFCDGKVMPLKPPPGLCSGNDESFVNHRSSPASPKTMLRIPFSRRSLWNDDFDPFMVALENVKEDKRGNHGRSKSMFTSFPACMCEQPFHEDLFSCNDNDGHKKFYSMPNPGNHLERNGSPWNQNGNTEQKSPLKLAEPRGVVFARRARLMANECPKKHKRSVTAFAESMAEERQRHFGKENIEVTWSGENNKKKKIKNFLFKSSSMKKVGDYSKQGKQHLEATKKPKISRKISLKSMGFVPKAKVEKVEEKKNVKVATKLSSNSLSLVECKEEEKVCEVSKMTVVKYKPRLLLCMGGT